MSKNTDNAALRTLGGFGLNVQTAKRVIQPRPLPNPPPKIGPPRLQPYIIATKKRGDLNWHEVTEGLIAQARVNYDNGIVEMFQGGTPSVTIQYCKPRKTKITRPPFFREMF